MLHFFIISYIQYSFIWFIRSYGFLPFSPKIREILSKTTLLVMIDDPVITNNLSEFLLQAQSGLASGSKHSGILNPRGNLLLTSNFKTGDR